MSEQADAIVSALRAAGFTVLRTDLIATESPPAVRYKILKQGTEPTRFDCLVADEAAELASRAAALGVTL